MMGRIFLNREHQSAINTISLGPDLLRLHFLTAGTVVYTLHLEITKPLFLRALTGVFSGATVMKTKY